MGGHTNGAGYNILAWATTIVASALSVVYLGNLRSVSSASV